MFSTDSQFPDFNNDPRLFKTFSPVAESGFCSRETACNASSSSNFEASHELTDTPDSQFLLPDSRLFALDSRCVPTCSSVVNSDLSSLPDGSVFLDLHARVFASSVYNFQGLRLPVPSSLRVPVWRSYLREYADYAVCDFLEFGWPVGFDYSCPLPKHVEFRNHKGALDFPDAVDIYLSSETGRGVVIGPFDTNPFSCPVAVSPLNSVPKPDTIERRIILDLSWPVGSSVNDGIPSGIYLAQEFELVYPTVDLIADCVAALGSGCLLFKRDLKRAYRQFPVDPHDYPLLGYYWNGHFYFDVVLPMGLRTAAMACQRSTNAVCYILSRAGCQVCSYLDDFIGVAPAARASRDFYHCGSLLTELGLQESPSKACPPSTCMTCLGVQVNTVDMTLSVTPERLNELEMLLSHWLTKKSAIKSELQSLVGKLSFVSKCVRQSRLFLARILALLRTVKRNHHHIKLSREFYRDIHWWLRFIRVYNGISIIPTSEWSSPDAIFATDACLSGCGGLTRHHFFHTEFPREVTDRFPSIHQLEVLAILLAVRLWGHQWRSFRILVQCDNAAVVSSLNSGRVQDPLLATCLRELWFLAALNEFELRAVHLSSADNRLADLLSRWHLNSQFQEVFLAKTADLNLQDVTVPSSYFNVADCM